MGHFKYSIAFSVACMGVAFWWGTKTALGGPAALSLVAMLAVMEVSLSFDNAVVNAGILRNMDAKWQQLFLTVGILIAVFGMRLVFPILVVAIATMETATDGFLANMVDVSILALNDPDEYARHLREAHTGIAGFGGMFLLMVFFTFLFDVKRDRHWLGGIEKWFAGLGRIRSLKAAAAIAVLLTAQGLMPLSDENRLTVLVSGASGIALFVVIHALGNLFDSKEDGDELMKAASRNGIMGFIYLEILDASFSFDGVIGAFAITRDVVIIMLGLAIGAIFVRSLTVFLLRKGMLDEFVFLEHGAHYAIGALGLIMLYSITAHVPELVTGLVGVALIALSVISSISDRKRSAGSS
ncbi:MAG: hypothetical protein A3G18_03950 [Rhodospirillales bacterium RIFCSPLOWO2_12_FULL_58_28]|nr:MAG: hypothetical protein A3H92_04830 [Rhodospirillales bacterium RIFCSPLOWO2_02_FULL_58_16]OHC78736.1 MAG: hypothetical protein A3G18_03950 [Rhodospirillales bacterium RIFCSPLOWO2_12_FULL_58_28]